MAYYKIPNYFCRVREIHGLCPYSQTGNGKRTWAKKRTQESSQRTKIPNCPTYKFIGVCGTV